MNWLRKGNKTHNEYLVFIYRYLLVLALFSVTRILFYLFNASHFPKIEFSRFLWIMLGGLKFDISALMYLNMLYTLLYLLPNPWKYTKGFKTALKTVFVLTNGIGLAVNSVDFIYFRFILKRTTGSVFAILKNEENMVSLWGQFFIDYWYVLLIFMTLLFILIRGYSLMQPKPVSNPRKFWYYPISLVFLAIFVGLTIIGARGGYKASTRPITISDAGDYVESPDEIAIVLNTPFALIRTFDKESYKRYNYYASEGEMDKVFSPIQVVSDSTQMNKKNVVVIILESFSREFFKNLNPDINECVSYVPFLDSLAQQSLVYKNAFANGYKSIDAIPSVTAGIPALVLPYVISEYSTNKINSLASVLNDEGYATSFFHGAPNGSMGFQAFTSMAGFQKYFGKNEYNNDDDFDGMWGIWDEPFFQYFNKELSAMPQPFFSAIFSVSSHHPFKVPGQYEGKFPKGELPLHQCLGYTDMALKKFFAAAKQQPWYNNTLFVITADHSTWGVLEEYKTSVNNFAIPLIFYTPDGSLKGYELNIAQQTDIMPTILSHLNYPKPFLAFGKDLLNDNNKGYAINYAHNGYQMIIDDLAYQYNGMQYTGIYDLKTDPLQKTNLVKTKKPLPGHDSLTKAIVQQFNNRMLDNRLMVK